MERWFNSLYIGMVALILLSLVLTFIGTFLVLNQISYTAVITLYSITMVSVGICVVILGVNKRNIAEWGAPFSLGGIFLYATAVVLLGAFFFIRPMQQTDFSKYPVIVWTAIVYLVFAFIGGTLNTMKIRIAHHKT